MQLSDLIGSSPTTTEAMVRGKLVTLTLTSARTQALIDELIPRPRPPMMQDPNKGSLAPLIPNTSDPDWLEAMEVRARRLQVIEVAIAMGLNLTQGDNSFPGRSPTWAGCEDQDERREWAEAAEILLGESLTRGELMLMANQMASAMVSLLPKEALGN